MRDVILGLTVAFAMGFGVADRAAAQSPGFTQDRTTAGCLFYNPGQTGWTNQWSRTCTPGQVIDGLGVMEGRRSEGGSSIRARLAGRMVGGYWHGAVDFEMSIDQGDGQGFVTINEGTAQFNMGCNVNQTGCTPGVAAAARAPVTPPAPSPPGRGPSPAYAFMEGVVCAAIPLQACTVLNPENADNILAASRSQLAQRFCGSANIASSRQLLEGGHALHPSECRQVLELAPGR